MNLCAIGIMTVWRTMNRTEFKIPKVLWRSFYRYKFWSPGLRYESVLVVK